jgi:hypothetical protein
VASTQKSYRNGAVGFIDWLDPLCSMSSDVDLAINDNPVVPLLGDNFLRNGWKPRSTNHPNGGLLNKAIRCARSDSEIREAALSVEAERKLHVAPTKLDMLSEFWDDGLQHRCGDLRLIRECRGANCLGGNPAVGEGVYVEC